MVKDSFDIAQICLNGHIINSAARSEPGLNAEYCSDCGEKTIVKCPHCQNEIRGGRDEWYSGDIDNLSAPPRCCHKCGKPYPWTQRKIDALNDVIAELEELTEEERDTLKKSVTDIISDTPDSEVAVTRFKKSMKKLSGASKTIFLKIVEAVATEGVKKMLGM